MHHLDAGDRNGRIPDALEAEHRIAPGLDVAVMILVDQIVQYFDDRSVVSSGSNLSVFISRAPQ